MPAPDPPSAPAPFEANASTGAAPRTVQELAGLRRQRDELTQQLVATHSRRGELVREMVSTDPGARGVLREQMAQLDFRVLMLEKDVTSVDHAIASAPPSIAADASPNIPGFRTLVPPRGFVLAGPRGPSANTVPVLLVLIFAMQLSAIARGRWRRGRAAAVDPMLRESAARLARVEQAVEAIAIEVERVSEGQRFITRALGPARAEPAYLDVDGR